MLPLALLPPVRPRRSIAAETPSMSVEAGDAFIARVTADGRDHAAWPQRLADELQRRFGAERVVFAVREGERWTVRAVTGGGVWDARTEFARATDEVWREFNSPTTVVTASGSSGALRNAAQFANTPAAAAIRFGTDHAVAGAILFGAAESLDLARLRADWSPQAAVYGNAVKLWSAAERGLKPRGISRANQIIRSRPGRAALVAFLLLAAIMAIPRPYHVTADAVVEPQTRRFVTAPFEGTLARVAAEAGDLVTAGQELARMDENQLRTDRAAAEGALQEAKRRHAAALAARQGGQARAAEYDLEQAEFKLASIDRRLEHAVLRSPLDGIVVRGDLRRMEGATVTVGQTLFEIAPPGSAIAEVAIPETDIALVREGCSLLVRFDGFVAQSWSGKVERIHPRGELIDGKNVFIADVELQDHGMLRPGMRGTATIAGDLHPLGWNLLRRPVLSFRRWTGW